MQRVANFLWISALNNQCAQTLEVTHENRNVTRLIQGSVLTPKLLSYLNGEWKSCHWTTVSAISWPFLLLGGTLTHKMTEHRRRTKCHQVNTEAAGQGKQELPWASLLSSSCSDAGMGWHNVSQANFLTRTELGFGFEIHGKEGGFVASCL